MEAPPPPPSGDGAGGGGGPGRGKAAAAQEASNGNEVVDVFGSDSYTPLFLLIAVMLGLFQVRRRGEGERTRRDEE
jgi:hypothetical protein